MGFWIKLFKFIKEPSVWITVVFGFFSVVAFLATVAFALLNLDSTLTLTALSIFAFITAYFIYAIVYYYKDIKEWYKAVFAKNKYTKRYMEDFKLRGYISVVLSFVINIGYAVTQELLAILSHSFWYGALAVYYVVLCFIRGGILIKHHRRRKMHGTIEYELSQAKAYRNCGIYLVFIILALSGAIVQMVVSQQGYKYAGIIIYIVAFYAFYKITMAIINLFKARKNKDLTIQSIRNLSLSDALVSMLALQTAMFNSFGGGYESITLFNILTGTGVSLIILGLSLYMIFHGCKIIQKIKENDNG